MKKNFLRHPEEIKRIVFGHQQSGINGYINQLCYNVWLRCHYPTHEDGNTDWFNDTLPMVDEHKAAIKELVNELVESETEKLVSALKKIAEYPRGGVVNAGECSGDRDDMIEIARKTLKEHEDFKCLK